ncbi:calcium-binding protein [Thalassococcus sp. S3]|uniref:calcium-binding protein n=1 Tax=Thalassococcus sp. S3 TaxID=2017482 RepID=UPI00102408B6|nr:calcium-binding protein [Thalassococcus sp. S3]QBF33210.1 hypothetical protein CFI11_18555 [Thalassococcus sp. S3]
MSHIHALGWYGLDDFLSPTMPGLPGAPTLAVSLDDLAHFPEPITIGARDREFPAISNAALAPVMPITAIVSPVNLIEGTDRNDQLFGTAGYDIIFGLGGNDYIVGGGDGDQLYGNSGDDFILGNEGDDLLSGGSGNDTLNGGAGRDLVDGEDGNDLLYGGRGDDSMSGGAGDDRLFGGDGDDVLFGNDGNDLLRLDDGDNVGVGGAGNDRIVSGDGVDQIFGGADDDFINSGGGNDIVRGGTGNDGVTGNVGDDQVFGDDGDDLVYGWHGDDQVHGGAGNDRVDGEQGNDNVSGGAGVDTLWGGDGNDTLEGGAGNDALDGGRGDDLLYAFSYGGEPVPAQDPGGQVNPGQPVEDTDTMTGWRGADTFVFRWLIDAKEEILDKHRDAEGNVDYSMNGVAGENDNVHDHWVADIGVKIVTDYTAAEGDQLVFEGHTVELASVEHFDYDGDGTIDTVLNFISNQGGNGGAHDQDSVGKVVILNTIIDTVEVDAGVFYGVEDPYSAIG